MTSKFKHSLHVDRCTFVNERKAYPIRCDAIEHGCPTPVGSVCVWCAPIF